MQGENARKCNCGKRKCVVKLTMYDYSYYRGRFVLYGICSEETSEWEKAKN